MDPNRYTTIARDVAVMLTEMGAAEMEEQLDRIENQNPLFLAVVVDELRKIRDARDGQKGG